METKRIKLIEDCRGSLLPISLADLAITPRRIFVVTGGYSGVIRGGHGPKNGSQLLVLLSGAVAMLVRRRNQKNETLKLSNPGETLWLHAGDVSWQRYDDTQSRLLVITDTEFSEENYLHASEQLCDADVALLESL